ncbi:pumilio domain member 4 [Perkinsus chesapeaki]|uniref:Pumilio domain member 4 n=1 Tax=Perkinsus chesapeaki TaxID=330153 RepID=A0A7J6MYX2_PERCH|nr:pumilio domain member 4 [Perkinsus chesapeaki]
MYRTPASTPSAGYEYYTQVPGQAVPSGPPNYQGGSAGGYGAAAPGGYTPDTSQAYYMGQGPASGYAPYSGGDAAGVNGGQYYAAATPAYGGGYGAYERQPSPPAYYEAPGQYPHSGGHLTMAGTYYQPAGPDNYQRRAAMEQQNRSGGGQAFVFDMFMRLSDREVVAYAEDHMSSIHLQDMLRKHGTGKDNLYTNDEVQQVVQRLVPHFVTLAFDPIGNYVSQAVIDVCDMPTFEMIISNQLLRGRTLYEMCTHTHGTRVVQKIISEANTRYHGSNQLPLLGAIRQCCLELALDPNGCYVLLKVLDVMGQSGWLLEILIDRMCDICCSQWGVVTVKKVIERATSVDRVEAHPHLLPTYPNDPPASPSPSAPGRTPVPQQQRLPIVVGRHSRRLLKLFVDNFERLSRDQFGNYAVQHLLQGGSELMQTEEGHQAVAQMGLIVRPQVVEMSKHKYSSNCMEHLLAQSSPEYVRSLITEIVSTGAVRELLLDKYGNYVLQKMLTLASQEGGKTFQTLVDAVQPCVADLMYGPSPSSTQQQQAAAGHGGYGGNRAQNDIDVGRHQRLAKKLIAKFPQLSPQGRRGSRHQMASSTGTTAPPAPQLATGSNRTNYGSGGYGGMQSYRHSSPVAGSGGNFHYGSRDYQQHPQEQGHGYGGGNNGRQHYYNSGHPSQAGGYGSYYAGGQSGTTGIQQNDNRLYGGPSPSGAAAGQGPQQQQYGGSSSGRGISSSSTTPRQNRTGTAVAAAGGGGGADTATTTAASDTAAAKGQRQGGLASDNWESLKDAFAPPAAGNGKSPAAGPPTATSTRTVSGDGDGWGGGAGSTTPDSTAEAEKAVLAASGAGEDPLREQPPPIGGDGKKANQHQDE